MPRKKYPKPFDKLGKRVRLGDTVVYPRYKDGELSLHVATIVEVPGRGCDVTKGLVGMSKERTHSRRIVLEHPERCAIVERFNDASV